MATHQLEEQLADSVSERDLFLGKLQKRIARAVWRANFEMQGGDSSEYTDDLIDDVVESGDLQIAFEVMKELGLFKI